MGGSWYSGGGGGSGGGSWYAGSGGSSGSWYAGGSSGGSYWPRSGARRRKKSSGHGGLLGGVGHFLGQTLSDFETAAVSSPGGLYTIGKAGYHDVRRHPWSLAFGPTALLVAEEQALTGHGPKSELAPLAKGMARQTAADVRHPLRHPGYTFLDALALASLGAGSAARIGAASRAARAGEGASAATRALLRAPEPGERVFNYGGLEVRGMYSRSASLRAAQRLLDRARRRFPEAPLGRRLPGRIGFELGERRRVLEGIERAPASALVRSSRFLTNPQQTALRVVAEGQPIEKRIAFHREQLAKGAGSKAGHRKQLRLLQAARKYVDEAGGTPRIKPDYPKLADVYEQTKALAGERERLLREVGREGAVSAERVQAPGRVIEGARYESGRGLRRQERRLARVEGRIAQQQQRVDALVERFARSEEHTRPLTIAEAEKALARTERRFDQLVEAKASNIPDLRRAVVYRNRENRRLRNRGWPQKPTIKEEARHAARREVYESLRTSSHPADRRFFAELEQADRLRAGLERLRGRVDPLLPEESAPPLRATAAARREHLGDTKAPTNVRLEAVLRHEQRRLRAHEKRGEVAQEAVAGEPGRGFHGAEGFAAGEFRVPYERKGPGSALGRHPSVGGGGTVAVPKEPGSIVHSFEGKVLQGGKFRSRTTHLVAESYVEAQRLGALVRARDEFIRAAHDTPESRFDIPIKLDELKGKSLPEPVREFMARYAEGGRVAGHEADALGIAYEVLRREVFPEPEALRAVEGVKWIDKRLLGGLNKPNPLIGVRQHTAGRLTLGTFDTVNDASKAAILLLKPAYAIPNLLGNAAMNIVQQGFAAPGNLVRAARLNAKLSRRAVASIDGAMGEGFASVLRAQGKASLPRRGMNVLARGWQALVDTGFRRSAFLHEARRAGFKSPDDLERLTTDPAHRERLVSIARRANREIIDYGRLGPFEREVVRRVIFFYPWIKGSTIYAARLAGEHPVIAAFTARLGQLGLAQQEQELGPVPSFAEGIFKVGQRGRTPLVASPASFSILQTPAQLAETAREFLGGDVKPAYELTNTFTPFPAALTTAVSGRDPFTGYTYPASKSRAQLFLEQLYQGLPQVTLWQRTHLSPSQRADRLYPYTNFDALMQFLVGGLAPRPVNLSKLHEKAAAEEAAISPVRHRRRKKSTSASWYAGG